MVECLVLFGGAQFFGPLFFKVPLPGNNLLAGGVLELNTIEAE
jgi:hypothetical protein